MLETITRRRVREREDGGDIREGREVFEVREGEDGDGEGWEV